MNKKRTLSLLLAAFSIGAFAQETAEADIQIKPVIKMSFLDSVKSGFVRHEEMRCIDSLWMKELANNDLFEDMQEDIERLNPDDDVTFDLSTELLQQRLKEMDAKSPFNIEYSKGLENIIKSYLKNRPKGFERLMAISQYYFPMFEEHLAKYDVPIEIKYLAVIESALNPRAKSRVGATGLWQFMYPTGKQYNLEVNSYVDERCDPLKATEAACQYLSSLYNIFGDWDLVLASYNAGPGNVTKAIRRSNGHKNYWNIRKNLPRETQGYVPAFLATMYIYEYGKEHGIKPRQASMTYFETDTVMVKRKMSFRQVADLLDVPVEELQFLNPIYKLDVIPFVADEPHYLRLPKDKVGLFTSNETAIYAYVDYEDLKRERPYFVDEGDKEALATIGKTTKVKTKYHTVKRGDVLGKIADKYNVSITDLRKWNKIKGNTIYAGQKLKINETIIVNIPQETAVAAKPKKAAKPEVKKEAEPEVAEATSDEETAVAVADADTEEAEEVKPVVVAKETKRSKSVNYEEERLYIVQKGDSLFSIARKHPGVTVENLKDWNKLKGENIQPGMKLKVKSAIN
ncbi:LysM peptidoglycan-binding domain-containing protein [Flavobacterium alkalisoli]|uniref:LysM peptidoglycan-binding domain-containing protein n=1 Tax=Flavobacterium alkalisoli TaxID=2602769 RepID=A0A5B9FNE5_9FLAO|nr:lytic transglycosylase domain-containing protein [Flavobacterium alkalisoli]QEE48803.1 LysM peptidoglycan-binding domain-containing protein [Flavobacterium alkalisoli]